MRGRFRRGINNCRGSSRNTTPSWASESAPIRRDVIIAMQRFFLGTIAPAEVLGGAERRRASQLVIVDVELIGFELPVVAQPRPRQRQQAGSHAEEAAEAQNRGGHFAADFVD